MVNADSGGGPSQYTPLFCKFGSINQYADNVVNTNKVCSLSYSATPQMKFSGNGFDGDWSYGFSTLLAGALASRGRGARDARQAPEHVAQMLQAVAAVGLAMRTSTRPVWLFVQSDTAKDSFASAVGLSWQHDEEFPDLAKE